MNTEKQEPVPVEATPAGKPQSVQVLEQHEVPEVLDFLKENGVAIVVGVAIAVAGFVGFSVWKNSKAAKAEAASNMLANSQTAPQFQEIINNYGNTPSAPAAYLALAAAYHDQGQYDLARHTFTQFQTTYPDHEMAPIAELGIAQSYEGAGNLQEAQTGYENFVARHPTHFMAPAATFGKARVLEMQGKFEEARAVYEDFIAANPESRWTVRAETGLDFVKKSERSVGQPVSAPPTTPVVDVAPVVEAQP